MARGKCPCDCPALYPPPPPKLLRWLHSSSLCLAMPALGAMAGPRTGAELTPVLTWEEPPAVPPAATLETALATAVAAGALLRAQLGPVVGSSVLLDTVEAGAVVSQPGAEAVGGWRGLQAEDDARRERQRHHQILSSRLKFFSASPWCPCKRGSYAAWVSLVKHRQDGPGVRTQF